MTEEEMADEYAKLNARQYIHNDGIGFCTSKEEVKQAFLAGLKAGKPKWHKVADGDLPKEQKDYITNIGVMTFTSLHDRLIWTTPLCEACDYYEEVTDEVIAWCEIPKYTEE